MKTCVPCDRTFREWKLFVRHMSRDHGVDRARLWSRAAEIGDAPCMALRSERGHWYLMVQDRLSL